MQESLIKFETAKLAKEKGFDIPVKYGVFGKKMKLTENHGWEKHKKLELRNWNTSESNSYSVPTQSLLQKWLREVHNIHVSTDLYDHNNTWGFDIFYIKPFSDPSKDGIDFTSYEEALENGLQEALKLIK